MHTFGAMAWFSSARSIRPLLQGFTDMHCHVLPGIDDGAPDVETSLLLLKGYRDLGVRSVIPTPHIMEGTYPNSSETILDSLAQLRAHQDFGAFADLLAQPAAEHMLDEGSERLLETRSMLPLFGSYVLVEFSWSQPPIGVAQTVFGIRSAGYLPVLAHPERYHYFHSMEKLRELKERGFLFQLNLLSLSDHYGSQVKQYALKLLKAGMYDFAGSDTHRLEHLERLVELSLPSKVFDDLGKCMNNSRLLLSKSL